jgi:hypothetical protein
MSGKSARGPRAATTKLRLCDELARCVKQQYCTKEGLLQLLVSQSACTPVRTFEVLVKTIGCFEWTRISIECDQTDAMQYLKRTVEERLGILQAMQEFYPVDIAQKSQEELTEVALKHDHVFQRDCSLVVFVDTMYSVVIKGAVSAGRAALMGVYVRVMGKEVLGHGVWQHLELPDVFMFRSEKGNWVITKERRNMEEALHKGMMFAMAGNSACPTTSTDWKVHHRGTSRWTSDETMQVRACEAGEKQSEQQRVAREESNALKQSLERPVIVVSGLQEDIHHVMGRYLLVRGMVFNRRAVWTRNGDQGRYYDRYLYRDAVGQWVVNKRASMEAGHASGWLDMASMALTPDQHLRGEHWRICKFEEGRHVGFCEMPEIRVAVAPR